MGNSFGKIFRLTTAGESHGAGFVGIVEGCPPGFLLSEADIQLELDRRRPGQSRYVSGRQESDTVQLLSGVFEGKTTGAPIALWVANEDAKPQDYESLKTLFRPGHADYTYHHKYGHRDYRGGGRASARETVVRVAAGAIAKKFLKTQLGLRIKGGVSAIGTIKAARYEWEAIQNNALHWLDPDVLTHLEHYLIALHKKGDSVGAEIRVEAEGMPRGLGEPIFDKLSADVGKAMLSIPAAKAVSIGDGFEVVEQTGSEHRDELTPQGFLSNHAGGVLGGISTGQPLIVTVAFKPTSSIRLLAQTIDIDNNPTTVEVKGRHDPCVGIRAVPVVEAMLALVLMDYYLRDFSLRRVMNEQEAINDN